MKKGGIIIENITFIGNEIHIKNLKDIKKNLKEFKNKYGSQSKIYYLNEKELLKIYNKKGSYNDFVNFKQLFDTNTETIIKPKKYLFINKEYYGHSMDLINGKTLFNIDNIIIDDLLESLIYVEEDLLTISKNNIILTDLHQGNILYDKTNNESKLIDCNSFIYEPNENINMVTHYNIMSLYKTIFSAITKFPFERKSNKKIINNLKESIISSALYGSDIYSLFSYFIEELELFVDKDINTVKELNTAIKKLK